LLAERPGEPVPIERTRAMVGEIDRLGERLEEFLSFARKRRLRLGSVDLRTLVTEAVALLATDAEVRGVQLDCDPTSRSATVEADSAELRELLTNLILNALQASAAGGRVEVSVTRRAREAEVEIRDRGHGLAPGLAERVFEPYFSTRPGGSGLGLAIARRIAEDHGGSVVLANREGGGAVARVALPLR
jgi:two-component system sensor histidine kinase HydH